MLISKLIIYFAAFIGLWYSSGLIVHAIKKLAQKMRVPNFAFAFFVLGFLTSLPELAVGLNAISQDRPEIFIGNLLGSAIVLFLLVIPLLAVIGKGIKIKKHMSDRNLLVTLGIIAVPALFAVDQVITTLEGFILVALYVSLFFLIRSRGNMLLRVEKVLKKDKKDIRHSILLRLIVGVILIFVSSNIIVSQTISLSEYFNIPTFIVSLLVLSIGTNLPEISLAIRSINAKAEDIAIGDYLGSAAANTFVFGVLVLIYNQEITTQKQFQHTFIIIVLALSAFFILSKGKSKLTRKEGIILLLFGVAFAIYEASNVIAL